MFSDHVSFNGGTRVEVISVLANCGRDTDRARRALVTWIRHKQEKGRSTEHILVKLRDIESKFIKDITLHSAFRDARAETFLPRAPDLPLPASVKRRSNPDPVPSITITPRNNPEPSPISSSPTSLSTDLTRMTRFSTTPSHSSYSSQRSDSSSGRKNTGQTVPHAQNASPSSSPRIQIPRPRLLRPGPDSPTTSSPEDSGLHLRYRYMSEPVASTSQYHGLPTPPSASPLESSFSFSSPRGQPARSNSAKAAPTSSEERFRPISHPASVTRRRVSPPATCPPDLPLPPIPSDGRDIDSGVDIARDGRLAKQPPTPVRSPYDHATTPVRPLPSQPIPSPVPGSDDLEHTDIIGASSLRQRWQESSREALRDVARQDSPLFVLDDGHAIQTGISPPPPYVDPLDTYAPPDIPTIGERLDRAVNICGGSPEVRLEVAKCIKFHRGYEPPYWQSCLQACGLNEEATKYLVEEMCKEVDWATSCRRAP